MSYLTIGTHPEDAKLAQTHAGRRYADVPSPSYRWERDRP